MKTLLTFIAAVATVAALSSCSKHSAPITSSAMGMVSLAPAVPTSASVSANITITPTNTTIVPNHGTFVVTAADIGAIGPLNILSGTGTDAKK